MTIMYPSDWTFHEKQKQDAWLDLTHRHTGFSYREIIEGGEFSVKLNSPIGFSKVGSLFYMDDFYLLLVISRYWEQKYDAKVRIIEDSELELKVRSNSPWDNHCYNFVIGNKISYSEKALAQKLIDRSIGLVSGTHRFRLFFDDTRWERLFIKPNKNFGIPWLFGFTLKSGCGQIILPFLFKFYGIKIEHTDAQLNEICKWVQPNLINRLPLEEIKKAYEELIEYIDNDLMKNTGNYDEWARLRGLDKSS